MIMLKKLLCAFALFPLFTIAQQLTPEVVGSAGDHFVAGGTQLSWTLGEIAIESYFGTSNQLTQGFHQPERPMLSVDELSSTVHINAFPNPFTESIQIDVEGNTEALTIQVYNALGQVVLTEQYNGSGPQTIDFGGLSSGIYQMLIHSSDQIIKNLKVQKQ